MIQYLVGVRPSRQSRKYKAFPVRSGASADVSRFRALRFTYMRGARTGSACNGRQRKMKSSRRRFLLRNSSRWRKQRWRCTSAITAHSAAYFLFTSIVSARSTQAMRCAADEHTNVRKRLFLTLSSFLPASRPRTSTRLHVQGHDACY